MTVSTPFHGSIAGEVAPNTGVMMESPIRTPLTKPSADWNDLPFIADSALPLLWRVDERSCVGDGRVALSVIDRHGPMQRYTGATDAWMQ